MSTMIAFILLELRGLTVWKGTPFSHRWPFNLHFTSVFFWLSNLFGCNAKVRARLINDWRLLKSPRKHSHSWIILSIAIHHFQTLVWYLIYQIQLLALVRHPNSIGFVFRMLDKIRNPLAAELLSNGGDPTIVALSIGCLRVRSWSSAGNAWLFLDGSGWKERKEHKRFSEQQFLMRMRKTKRQENRKMANVSAHVYVERQELFSLPFLLPQASRSGVHSSSLFRPVVDNGSEARGGSREDRWSVCPKVADTPHGPNNKHSERRKDVWPLACFRIKGEVREESGGRSPPLIILSSRCFSFWTLPDSFLTCAMLVKYLED